MCVFDISTWMNRKLRFLLSLFLIATLATSACRKDAQQSKDADTTYEKQPEPRLPTLDEGRKEVYELWKYEKKLASIGNTSLSEEEKQALLSELNSRSFIHFSSKHRKSFRTYRDKIAEVASLKGFKSGFAIGEMQMAKNAVLGDWALDRTAAQRFDDQIFNEDLTKHLEFMKTMIFMGKKEDIQGSALIFAQLYKLTERLVNASPSDEKSNMIRAAILGINPQSADSQADRIALSKFRSELIDLSRNFGDDDWSSIRTQAYIMLIQCYNNLRLSENDFRSSSYWNIAEGVRQMDKLVKGGQ